MEPKTQNPAYAGSVFIHDRNNQHPCCDIRIALATVRLPARQKIIVLAYSRRNHIYEFLQGRKVLLTKIRKFLIELVGRVGTEPATHRLKVHRRRNPK